MLTQSSAGITVNQKTSTIQKGSTDRHIVTLATLNRDYRGLRGDSIAQGSLCLPYTLQTVDAMQ